jgi:hypothetical protein
MDYGNRDPLGLSGVARNSRYKVDYNERLMMRMVRAGWLPSDEKLKEIKDSIEQVAISSPDHRARIMAAKLFVDAEIAHVNSVNLLTNEDTEAEASEDESADPETFD